MLPRIFKPFYVEFSELTRIGSLDDGGYILTKELIKNTNHCVSFGISDNFDFEKHLNKLTKCSVESYDYSIDKKFWFNRLKKDFIKFISLKIFKPKKIYNMFKYLDFLFFFNKKNNSFFLRKIDSKEFIKCMKKYENSLGVLLKIDIEGSEYDIIDLIEQYEKNIVGFVIEFHDLEKNIIRLKSFITNLKNYNLIHIHGNNYSIINNQGDPSVLEMTFSHIKYLNNFKRSNNRNYPINRLDYPNAKRAKDITLNFEN
jgi:hypothetical protein